MICLGLAAPSRLTRFSTPRLHPGLTMFATLRRRLPPGRFWSTEAKRLLSLTLAVPRIGNVSRAGWRWRASCSSCTLIRVYSKLSSLRRDLY